MPRSLCILKVSLALLLMSLLGIVIFLIVNLSNDTWMSPLLIMLSPLLLIATTTLRGAKRHWLSWLLHIKPRGAGTRCSWTCTARTGHERGHARELGQAYRI